MKIPVYIHKDPETCFGVTIPDIPGCFTAGDTFEEALANVQEAIELWVEAGEGFPEEISAIDTHLDNPVYTDGFWALAELDTSFLNEKYLRINITMRESDRNKIDHAARAQNKARSAFLVDAAMEYIRNHG